MMKKRVLAVLLVIGVCAAMSGCAKNEKPMSPDQVESTSSAESSDNVGGSSGESSSTDGDNSGVSVVEEPVESSSDDSSGGVVIPRKPDGTNDLSEMRALYVGDEVYYVDWTPAEFAASGWKITIPEGTMSSGGLAIVTDSDWNRKFVLQIYNESEKTKTLSECGIGRVTAYEDGAYIQISNGRVFVGMSKDVLDSNMVSCKLVETKAGKVHSKDNWDVLQPATRYLYISDEGEVVYDVTINNATALVCQIGVSSLKYYQSVGKD